MAPCSSSNGTARSGASSPSGCRRCGTSCARRSRRPPPRKARSSATRSAIAPRKSERDVVPVIDPANTLLSLNNVEVIYDHVILVLKGVSLAVPEGGIAALLGANGAGKSTTLKAISGLLRTERGLVTKGSVELLGVPIHERDPAEIVTRGIVQVMEGRRVFEHLTVEENLLAGGYTQRAGAGVRRDLERVYEYFPRLRERRT